MSPTMFLLIGNPGVGKLTVARELVRRLEDGGETVRLVDNHSINNPIFRLIENDGMTPLPPSIWDRVGEMWSLTLETLETLTPTQWSLVFTMFIDGTSDIGAVPRLARTAEIRGCSLVVARLICDPEENARRIVSPERAALMKSIDPEEPHRLAADGDPYDPGHPHQITLDTTSTPPVDTARSILEHAESLG